MPPDSHYTNALWKAWEARIPQQPLSQLGRGLLVVGLALVFPLYVAGFSRSARIPAALAFGLLLILALVTLLLWNQMLQSNATIRHKRRAILFFFSYQSLVVLLLSLALLAAGLYVTALGVSALSPVITAAATIIYLILCIRFLWQAPEMSAEALRADETGEVTTQNMRSIFTITGALVASSVVILDFITGSQIPINLIMISGFVLFGAFIVLPPGLLIASQIVTLVRANHRDYD